MKHCRCRAYAARVPAHWSRVAIAVSLPCYPRNGAPPSNGPGGSISPAHAVLSGLQSALIGNGRRPSPIDPQTSDSGKPLGRAPGRRATLATRKPIPQIISPRRCSSAPAALRCKKLLVQAGPAVDHVESCVYSFPTLTVGGRPIPRVTACSGLNAIVQKQRTFLDQDRRRLSRSILWFFRAGCPR